MTRTERIEALRAHSYTEREAAFLTLVALHGGYFLRRQYRGFAGCRGGVEERFLRRADSAGHLRYTLHSNRTSLYHLFARAVYRAIGEEDSRNRRARPFLSIKARLMALDFVLDHRDVFFLETEREKVEYFCQERSVERSHLPGQPHSAGCSSRRTRRIFAENCPIFLNQPDECGQIPSFCYVDEGVLSNSGFDLFLRRYRLLFVTLRRFRLVYVAAEHRAFRRAEQAFDRFVDSLAAPELHGPGGTMGEYFRLRLLFETRQYKRLDKAKLDRLRDLSQRFRRPKTEVRFRQWAEGVAATERFGAPETWFEAYRSPHSYDIFGANSRANSTM